MMRTDPARYAVLIGNLLDAFGPDHILWCTDTPVIGPPRWQIEAFQGFTIPEAMIEQREFQPLTPEVKHKIFGRNAARIFGIDIVAARRGTEEAKNFAQAETPGVGGTRLHCRTISRLSADSGRSWNRDRAARFDPIRTFEPDSVTVWIWAVLTGGRTRSGSAWLLRNCSLRACVLRPQEIAHSSRGDIIFELITSCAREAQNTVAQDGSDWAIWPQSRRELGRAPLRILHRRRHRELAVQDCIVAPLVGSAPIPAGRGTEIERQARTSFQCARQCARSASRVRLYCSVSSAANSPPVRRPSPGFGTMGETRRMRSLLRF